MKFLINFTNWLYLVSLSLWVSGMMLLGILVEIVVRTTMSGEPALASQVMNKVMDIFNVKIIYYCMFLMALSIAIRFFADRKSARGYSEPRVTRGRYTKQVIFIVMAFIAIYVGDYLRPEMHEVDKLKKAQPHETRLQKQFDSQHSLLVRLVSVNMILGLILFYIHGKEMTRFREDEAAPEIPQDR